jgi:hypothetical protein
MDKPTDSKHDTKPLLDPPKVNSRPGLKELLMTDEARGLLMLPERRVMQVLRPPPELD